MALTLDNAKAFRPLMDTDARIQAHGVRDARAVDTRVNVSAPNPYAENTGAAPRAVYWAVVAEASAFGSNPEALPGPGAIVTFPSRRDLPRLFAQRTYIVGPLCHMQCTSSERAAR
jgi:hypothetical protein